MCAGTAEWSLQCRSRNVKIFSSTTLHQFHSEFVTRNWFRWQALQTKSGRRYPKITFYPVKANFLNNSRGGERDGRRGERGRETAPTRSATDRKIKEHDAVGSQGIVLRDAKERTGFAGEESGEKYKKSRVHHASAPSPGLQSSSRRGKLIRNYLLPARSRKVYLKRLQLFILPSSVQDYLPFITADQKEGGRSSYFLLTYLSRKVAVNDL